MTKILKPLILCLLILLIGCQRKLDITITLNFNRDNYTESISTKANQNVTLPKPTRDGYTFTHWYDLEGNKYEEISQFNYDLTIYANWEANSYTVKFIDYDESIISTQTVKYKKSATKPHDPTRENYVFIGWDKGFQEIKSDINIYAQYEKATKGLIYQLETDGYSIVGYNGTSNDVTIPSQYKGYPVIAIGANAFERSTITSVSLPDTITVIGYQAFFECSNLSIINIPESVKVIEDEAFMNCVSLVSITLPTQVIGESAFYNCSSLSNITILNTVTTILDSAFYNCSRLITLYIPESVTVIGKHVISWCQNLEYIYTTEDNVETLRNLFNDAGYIYARKVQFAAK